MIVEYGEFDLSHDIAIRLTLNIVPYATQSELQDVENYGVDRAILAVLGDLNGLSGCDLDGTRHEECMMCFSRWDDARERQICIGGVGR